MSTLERAVAIATLAHAGQVDLAGAPYIQHPLRVMQRMRTMEEKIVAVFHDLLEDTDITAERLAEEGFSSAVIEAVRILTRQSINGNLEPYKDYIRRVAGHPLARAVKLEDLDDNMDLSRIARPTEKDFKRVERYREARKVIEAAMAEGR